MPHDNKKSFIAKKKQFGQHFLRKQSTVDNMINAVPISTQTTIMEIGCGDGFLTQSLLQQTPAKKIDIFEIDPEWAQFVGDKFAPEPRLHITLTDILEVDFTTLFSKQPLVLLANLPYQITFPLFYRFAAHKDLFSHAVVMIQEEAAQKIVAKKGRGYSATSLYLQHNFTFTLLEKVEPGAFTPPPKVYSRLLKFVPRTEQPVIDKEIQFWRFVEYCFASPRQTLRNNLKRTHFFSAIEEKITELSALTNTLAKKDKKKSLLDFRAQELTFEQFHAIWEKISQVTL